MKKSSLTTGEAAEDYEPKVADEFKLKIHELDTYVRALMDGGFSYALLLDSEGKILYYSKNLAVLAGVEDCEPFVGTPILEACEQLYSTHYVANATRRIERILAGEDDFFEDDTIEWPTGEKRIYRIYYRRIADEGKTFSAILLFAHDITDLRLEEANRRVYELMNSTALPCLIWDEAGDVVAYNRKIAEVMGMPPDLPPDDFNKIFRSIQPLHQPDGSLTEDSRQKGIRDAREDGFAHVTVRLQKIDGSYKVFEVNATRIEWLFGYRFVVYYDDLTEAMEKADAAREAEERIKMMLDCNPLMCIFWDDAAHVIDCNEVALHLLEISDKNELCNNFYNYMPIMQPSGDTSPDSTAKMLKKADEEGSTLLERIFQSSSGELIPVESKVVKIPWKDSHRYISYSRDLREIKANEKKMQEITERERKSEIQREAASAANEAKSIFITNISHEIRTPMSSIIGFTELAMDDDIPSKTHDFLYKIMESSMGLLQIINKLLDISKIESGRLEFEIIPFDLEAVFDFCKMTVEPSAIENDVSLVFAMDPVPGRKLHGDPMRLRQILINLLSNAVKFTNPGTVKLASVVKSVTESSVLVGFEVSDTGIGMTAEQILRIYEPFLQADSSMARKYGGTGLGLPITKRILELFGSWLEVESAPGVGSVFRFDMTFETTDDLDETAEDEAAEHLLQKPMFTGDVLVCEDNRMNQLVISEHLTRVGLHVIVADNGEDGVENVKKRMAQGTKPYDLILMDIHMPDMDGLKTTSLIRQMEKTTPILAMTSDIKLHDSAYYEEFGMNGCLDKPFTSQELWRVLLKHLEPAPVAESGKRRTGRDESKLLAQLKADFVKSNQGKHEEILAALRGCDVKLAHRLAHTLKTNAGLIGKTPLQQAAANVEKSLKTGENKVSDKELLTLNTELDKVLNELEGLLASPKALPKAEPEALDAKAMRKIINELEPLLLKGDTKCLNYVDILRSAPDSEELISQIEDFDFGQAAITLEKLKEGWGYSNG